MSSARRLTKGFLATLLSPLITAAGNLVLVPVFLAQWGEQRYGEWLVLSAAVAYMSVVDFGLQTYVVNRLNQTFTHGRIQDYHRILHSAFRLSLSIALAAIALLIVVVTLAPLADWLGFIVVDNRGAAIIGTLLGVQLVGAVPLGLIAGVYRTVGEYHRGVMIGNAQRALGFGLTAGVVAGGGDPIAVAAVQLIPIAMMALFVWVDLRRRHREIRLGVREGTVREALTLLVPSFFFFLLQLAAGLALQGTTLVVGAVLGIAAVVVFTTTRTLAHLIAQITGTVNATLWPDLTTLEVQGRYDTLRELQRLSTKSVMALTLAAALFLHFNGAPLMQLWVGGQVAYDAELMSAFLVYVLYLGYVNTTTMVLIAANRHRATAILNLAATAAGIGLAIPGALWFGNVGVIVAMLVADVAIRGIAQSRDACRMIAQPLGGYLADVLGRGSVVAGGGVALVWSLEALVGGDTIASMIVSALLCGLVIGGLTFAVWLDRDERRWVLRVVRAAAPGQDLGRP